MSVYVPGYTRANGTKVKPYVKKKRAISRSTRKVSRKPLTPKQIRFLKATEKKRLKNRKR